MTPEVQMLINKCVCNPFRFKVFINNENELIISQKGNVYFRLADVKTELDFKCKVLEWLSYFCADNHWYNEYNHLSNRMESMINYILGTDFTHEEYQTIYCRMGNAIHHQLTIDFINSNYDFKMLSEACNCKEICKNMFKALGKDRLF